MSMPTKVLHFRLGDFTWFDGRAYKLVEEAAAANSWIATFICAQPVVDAAKYRTACADETKNKF